MKLFILSGVEAIQKVLSSPKREISWDQVIVHWHPLNHTTFLLSTSRFTCPSSQRPSEKPQRILNSLFWYSDRRRAARRLCIASSVAKALSMSPSERFLAISAASLWALRIFLFELKHFFFFFFFCVLPSSSYSHSFSSCFYFECVALDLVAPG